MCDWIDHWWRLLILFKREFLTFKIILKLNIQWFYGKKINSTSKWSETKHTLMFVSTLIIMSSSSLLVMTPYLFTSNNCLSQCRSTKTSSTSSNFFQTKLHKPQLTCISQKQQPTLSRKSKSVKLYQVHSLVFDGVFKCLFTMVKRFFQESLHAWTISKPWISLMHTVNWKIFLFS